MKHYFNIILINLYFVIIKCYSHMDPYLICHYPLNGNLQEKDGRQSDITISESVPGSVELIPDRFGNADSAYRLT